MRITTWNCNGALRKKLDKADSLTSNLYIVQECEDPALSTEHYREWAGDYLWVGTNKNKGIGVFPKNGNRVKKLDWYGEYRIEGVKSFHLSAHWSTSDLKLFLPFVLNDEYTVLGVWTKGSDSEAFGYVGQLWKYIQIHGKDLSKPKTMILGDLNSNAVWDKSDRWWSHSGVIRELKELDFQSLYHVQESVEQGSENQATFYLHRNIEKAYHIDYAFVYKDLIKSSSINIDESGEWLDISDHMPVTITLND